MQVDKSNIEAQLLDILLSVIQWKLLYNGPIPLSPT